MAEIKVTDLPLMTLEDFTSNDRFLMVDNGDARAMPKTVFDQWIAVNVKGEKGEQGVAARKGSLYLRTDGGNVTTLWIKTSGVGNTGWIAK